MLSQGTTARCGALVGDRKLAPSYGPVIGQRSELKQRELKQPAIMGKLLKNHFTNAPVKD